MALRQKRLATVIALVVSGLFLAVAIVEFGGPDAGRDEDATGVPNLEHPDKSPLSTPPGNVRSELKNGAPSGMRSSVNPGFPRAYSFVPNQPAENGPVLPVFNQLKILADAGDAHAGFRLFDEMYRCIALQYANVENKQTADRVETDLHDCEGIGSAEIAEAYRQLERAAERGDVEAQLMYAEAAYQQFPTTEELLKHPEFPLHFRRNYLRFLEAAVNGGSVRAIRTLANAYRTGQAIDADPFKAYAYEYAMTVLQPDWQRANLDWSARSLTPEQIASAQRLAAQILERCCK